MDNKIVIDTANKLKIILDELNLKGGFSPENFDAVNEAIEKINALKNDPQIQSIPMLKNAMEKAALNYAKIRDEYLKKQEGII